MPTSSRQLKTDWGAGGVKDYSLKPLGTFNVDRVRGEAVGKAPTVERGIVDSIFTGKAMSPSQLLRDCTRVLLRQHFLNLNEVRLYAKLSTITT